MSRRLFRMKKMEDETVQAYCMRTAGLARSIWKKDEVPLLHEVIAESTRRAMGWPDSKNGNTVLTSFFWEGGGKDE